MQNRTNSAWILTGAPILGLMLVACAPGTAQSPAGPPTPPTASVPAPPPPPPPPPPPDPVPMPPDHLTVANTALRPNNTRPLGVFATEEEAVAAARAAGMGPGIYGLATAGGRPVAITADGTVYLREGDLRGDAPANMTSGPAQRPPQSD